MTRREMADYRKAGPIEKPRNPDALEVSSCRAARHAGHYSILNRTDLSRRGASNVQPQLVRPRMAVRRDERPRRAWARACANIALIKYWGKRENATNGPATFSLSLALDALVTETTVESSQQDGRDRIMLNGSPARGQARERIQCYLDLWRQRGLISGAVCVTSFNRFPTSAGLASSASGFAALAGALAAYGDRSIDRHELSRLARLGSGSAARSVAGGLATLPAGRDPASRQILPAAEVPWGMVIAITSRAAKQVPSRAGMAAAAATSPYYPAWISQAVRDAQEALAAATLRDLGALGRIVEANALAMHACMLAARPALLYWNPASISLIQAARRWRAEGLEAYATLDAGPNVAFLARREDLDRIARRVRRVADVLDVIRSLPGQGVEARAEGRL